MAKAKDGAVLQRVFINKTVADGSQPPAGSYCLPGLLLCGLLLGSLVLPWLALLALPLTFGSPRWALVFLLAFGWSYQEVQQRLVQRLPLAQNQQLRLLEGHVLARTESERSQRLLLQLSPEFDNHAPQLRRIRVSYYGARQLQVGDRMLAEVKLRAPRNLANGLAFDYEVWLLARGIDAGGYVRAIRSLDRPGLPRRESWRQQWLQQVPVELRPWLIGLVFADSQALAAPWWRQGQRTGTVHLFVVSGLHLALVAALGWGVSLLLARLLAAVRRPAQQRRLSMFVPKLLLPTVLMLAVVAFYLWLSMGGIAVWRAWLMMALASVWWLSQRRWQPLQLLLWVAVVLLLDNPLAHQLAGFAMSLLVVLGLVLVFWGRHTTRWSWFWLPSWAAWWMLLPLLMLWLQPLGIWQWLANLLAVPLVSLSLLPGLLLRALLAALAWDGALVWWLDAALLFVVDGLRQWLNWVVSHSDASWARLPMVFYSLWWGWGWLLWRGLSPKLAIGGTAVLLLLLAWPSRPTAQLRFLDVGQGLSMVAVAEQALVYDLGARWSPRFNMGEAVVVPTLRDLSVTQLSTLVVSHSDNDHAGGLTGLLHWYQPQVLWGGQPERHEVPMRDCHAWTQTELAHDLQVSPWYLVNDNLRYRFFPIAAAWRDNDNNHSCVMQLRWFEHTILLPGDIEYSVEQQLVAQYGEQLRADWLVVGHHGSRGSTSKAWLNAVQPRFAVISAGWQNRFGHPHDEVLSRLSSQGVMVWRTDQQGGLAVSPSGEHHGLRMTPLSLWQNR
ncbi:DNA internalization-related competence protein ComEC/Rec2 [Bacterioplanes sanyensis]|uniref:DNA internalization-related competence protein ComEC/Rec2 n=1 Tax=Bacterioplanes sanyensis TaxID=1249553 RepID=A0A222FLT8_9GAMM|nr:DNA internalization-related competence protein ComEC/Rec2 [Bacterioplanes sanyensis]ASP39985.1 DNA internalization-related competence protein ComEC/Rec2 [Bacterioplanes sanyensis]